MLVVCFGVGFVHKLCLRPSRLERFVGVNLYSGARGLRKGARRRSFRRNCSASGYVIGPRIASIMVGGGVLAYLVFVPTIAILGDGMKTAIPRGKKVSAR